MIAGIKCMQTIYYFIEISHEHPLLNAWLPFHKILETLHQAST